MNIMKRTLAMLIAIIMVIGTVSVAGFAAEGLTPVPADWDESKPWIPSSNDNYAVTTQIYRYNGTDWVPTDKVVRGEEVKARISIATNYPAGPGEMYFAFDVDYFDIIYPTMGHDYPLNPNHPLSAILDDHSGYRADWTASKEKGIYEMDHVITPEESAQYDFLLLLYGYTVGSNCQIWDDSDWIIEVNMRVKEDADPDMLGEVGDFFVLPSTVQTVQNEWAVFDITRTGKRGHGDSTAIPELSQLFADMAWLWYENMPILNSTPVSVVSDALFFPGSGASFPTGTETTEDGAFKATRYTDETGVGIANLAVPNPSRLSDIFLGWIPADENGIPLDYDAAPVTFIDFGVEDQYYAAKWDTSDSNITVTFDGNGGFFGPDATAAVAGYPGTPFAFDSVPERAGYDFLGWSTSRNATEADDTLPPAVFPPDFTTYYAIWDAKPYTITYIVDGEQLGETLTFDCGTELTHPTPAKEGYNFIKWRTRDNATGTYITTPNVMPAYNVLAFAAFEPAVYSVQYFVDGSLADDRTLEFGTPIPGNLLTYDVPDGYEISGWYTTPDYQEGTELAAGATVPAGGINLYAYLTPATYDARFWNGSELVATVPTEFLDAIVAPDDPILDGYTFTGWSPSVSIMDDVAGKDFYATWDISSFDVTYMDGDDVYEAFNIVYGEPLEVPADPEKEGYDFVGWSTTATSTVGETLPATMPAEDLTYHAIYSVKNYNIRYVTGSGNFTVPYAFGAAVVDQDDPTKEGYDFTGWAWTETDSGATLEGGKPGTMPAKDLTATAQFTAREYTLTYKVDFADGNGYVVYGTPETIAYGTAITPKAAPTQEGYTFSGWTTIPSTMPNGDYEVRGSFAEANNYNTITYYVDGVQYGEPVNCAPGSSLPADPTVTKTGYTVSAWTWKDAASEVIAKPETMPSEDISAYATTNINKYTITYYVNGTQVEEDELEYNSAVEVYNYTAAGSNVSAWAWTYLNGEGETVITAEPATMPAHDLIANATTTAITHTVTFMVNGEVYGEVLTVAEGESFSYPPADPTAPAVPEGQYFVSWDNDVTVMGTDDIVITALLNDIEYSVIFNDYDPAAETAYESVGSIVVYYTDFIAEEDCPDVDDKTGYSFVGWSVDETEDGIIAVPKAVSALEFDEHNSVELFAIYEANPCTAYFYTDETCEDTVDEITVDFGSVINPPADPTRTGFDFNGWIDLDTEEPADFTDTAPVMDTEDGKFYYAEWTPHVLSITYDANGGKFADDSTTDVIEVTYGEAIAEHEQPTNGVLVFSGWAWTYQLENGDTVNCAEAPTTVPDYNLTATAQWSEPGAATYTIETYTMDTDGHYPDAPVETTGTANPGDVVSVPAAAEGFYIDEEQDNALSGTIADGDELVLTVYYARKECTVIWDANGGTFGDDNTVTETYLYGAPVDAHTAPTWDGHTFANWAPSVASPATNHSAPVTYTAQWDAAKYAITYIADEVPVFSDLYAYNDAVTVRGAYNKVGYTFTGWSWTKTADETAASAPANMPAYDLTATATYTVNMYSVTYDLRGGNIGGDEDDVVFDDIAFGVAIPGCTAPVRSGYSFAGWLPAPVETMPAEDLTYYALWELVTYTQAFDANGGEFADGTTEKVVSGTAGSTLVSPAAPTREGYTFNGWDSDVPQTIPTSHNNYSATWIKNEHTVTYDLNGGNIDGDESDVVFEDVAYGDDIPTFDGNPVKEGCSFLGWTPDAPDAMPDSDLTFTAEWSENEYTVTYDLDGGNIEGNEADIAFEDVLYGAEIPTPENAPVKEGHTFNGWTPDAPASMPAENLTFTAEWKVNTHTATYVLAGGNIEGNEDDVVYEIDFGEAVATPAEPEKEGCTFLGWTPDAPDAMPDSDLTFTAEWSANEYAVTYDLNGGNIDGDESDVVFDNVIFGTAIPTPDEAPVKAGYTFDGWTPEAPDAMPAENLTFTAQWKVNTHTVTYVLAGGNIDGNTANVVYNIDFGEAITKPANPVLEGCAFAGWTPAIADTMPDMDLTYTATWTPEQYTITYIANDENIGTDSYNFGAAVTVKPAPTKPGATFAGWSWSKTDGTTATEPATMPAFNLIATATWISSEQLPYTIETYTMGTDGTYPAPTVETGSGDPGETVSVTPAAPEGFYLDETQENVLSGTLAANNETVLKIYYARETCTIVWDANGGSFGGSDTVTESYLYGATVTEHAAPDFEGHTFERWDPTVSPIADNLEEEITYTAVWSDANYTITYMVDGVEDDVDTYAFGAAVTVNSAPVKPGFDFTGWTWTKKADSSAAAEPTTMPAYDLVATAGFTAKKYTATYVLDGGNIAGDTDDIVFTDIAFGATIPTPATNPEKEHYTFDGWNPAVVGTMPAENVVYTAKWAANTYTVTFDANGGAFTDSETTKTFTGIYGTTFAAPTDPVREGYSFDSWDKTVSTTIVGNETYKAQWIERHKAIFYYDYENDHSDIFGGMTGDVGDAIVPPAETPEKPGYEFLGWAPIVDDEIGEVVTGDDFGEIDTEDKLFTAVWEKGNSEYTVETYLMNASGTYPTTPNSTQTETAPTDSTVNHTPDAIPGYTVDTAESQLTCTVEADGSGVIKVYYEVNKHTASFYDGGTLLNSKEFAYGAAITSPTAPTKEGFNFVGWDDEAEATTALTDLGTMPDSDKSFYAVWAAGEYTVKYYDGFDTDVKATQAYNFGDTITPHAGFTHPGYIFAGWDWYDSDRNPISQPATMPADNLYVIALWEEVDVPEHTATFVLAGGNIDGNTADVVFTLPEGAAMIRPAKDPVKEGYEFAGWAPAVDATMPDHDVTYTAQWNEPSTDGNYDVTYFTDGSVYDAYTDVPVGSAIPGPAKNPTKFGYRFAGWKWYDSNGNAIMAPSDMPAEDISAVAQWDKVAIVIPDIDIPDIDIGDINIDIEPVIDLVDKIISLIPEKTEPDTTKPVEDDTTKPTPNVPGTNIPDTGSATGIAVFAAISTAAAAAYVFTKKKRK